MSVDTDNHGQALVPHHDGNLDGISCSPGGSEVTIHYRCTEGVSRVLLLHGVHDMDVSSFRNGNIILSIMVHPAEEAPARATPDQLVRLGYGRSSPLKGKFLFILDSSYGAEIVADCDDVVAAHADRPAGMKQTG